MTDLKTLKDFDISCGGYGCDGISYSELKAEAIKWFEHLGGDTTEYENTEESAEVCRWIKHFFNLSEEDLNGS